ncbi:hypothetical protein V5F38_19695 [Xanthobacter sp. V0B-10]|uniref:hypothetical protein n=1 Tax=Xanthobacter albus TaxID=3119929 RepID=UPI0037297609
MLTVAELITAMDGSGRRLTPRTARNWWSIGLLPRPARTGLGQGVGTVSFWRDRRVLVQAQIAHDLLGRGVSLEGAAAGLWLVGFPAPIKVVRQAFARQVAGHFRRGRGRSRDGLETGLWEGVGRFVRQNARVRGGSGEDDESIALYALTGELLELLYGVGDGVPEGADSRQWAADTATEMFSQLEFLAPLSGVEMAPSVRAETVEEVVTWISETASLQRQQDAITHAQPHDWARARRIMRVVIGLLDRADAAASPEQHAANRALFTRLAIGWARLLFPVVLAMVRNPQQRQTVTRTIFTAGAIVRRGPVSTRIEQGRKRAKKASAR